MQPVGRMDLDESAAKGVDQLGQFQAMTGPLELVFLPGSFYFFDYFPDVAWYELPSALVDLLDCFPEVADVARHY